MEPHPLYSQVHPPGIEKRREGVERKKRRRITETETRMEQPLLLQGEQERVGLGILEMISPISPSEKAACQRAMSNLRLAFKPNV